MSDDHRATNGDTNDANTKHIASSTSSLTIIQIKAINWILLNHMWNIFVIPQYNNHINIINIRITPLNQKNFHKIILLLLIFFDASRKIVFCDISCWRTLVPKNTMSIIHATSIKPIQKSLITLACSLRANHQAIIVDIINNAHIQAMIYNIFFLMYSIKV